MNDLILKPMGEIREAIFSDDRVYRYTLKIQWDESLPLVQFIGLNPSTADEVRDDNTVRKCKQFARNWGYGGIVMTNIFPYRDTDPKGMKTHAHPNGKTYPGFDFTWENDFHLWSTASECELSVAAWGNHGTYLDRGRAVVKLFQSYSKPLKCFRITKAGQPEHPLYMPYTQPLIDYNL